MAPEQDFERDEVSAIKEVLRQKIALGDIADGDLIDVFNLVDGELDETSRAFVIRQLDGYVGAANKAANLLSTYRYKWYPSAGKFAVYLPHIPVYRSYRSTTPT